MFKKEKVKDGPARERPKAASTPEETAAYEDSWYRSLKALAERRRNHDDNRSSDPGSPQDRNGRADGSHLPDPDAVSANGRRFGSDEELSVPED
jgi:hypothetical protein